MALPTVPTACSSVDPHGLILKEGEREGREELVLEGRRGEGKGGGIEKREKGKKN